MKKILPYILIVAALATGCKRSEFEEQTVDEGRETNIAIKMDGQGIWASVDTKNYGLTDPQELQIKSLDVLVFNSAQNLVSRVRLINPAALTNSVSTKSGSGMSVYVVANLNPVVTANGTPNDPLGMATTVTALKNITITNLLVDVQAAKTLIMYGSMENLTINPTGANSITIPLDYVAAKITVNMRNSLITPGDDFQLLDWKLVDLARYAYIFGRAADAVDPNVASDFLTQTSTNMWNDGTIDVGGVATPVKTTTFYIFENRRGVTSNLDPKLKAGNTAPLRPTKLVAHGYYRTATGVTGLQINLVFGANSYNNYDVERTKRYTYNVNVKSINDIAIDTRFDDVNVGFQAEVMSPILDAHYDFRPLRVSAYEGASVVEILDENGNSTAGTNFWLKISNLNITKFIPSGGSYIRPTYNPATDMTNTLSVTHSLSVGMESKWAYLYAEEYLVDGATRTAKVRVTHTPVGAVALPPTEITITQRGVLLAGFVGMRVMTAPNVLSNTDYRLATEVIEEATLSITPGNLANERTMTMQFGFNGIQIVPINTYTMKNGFDNTLAMTLSDISNGVLRTPYGRTGAATTTHELYDPIYNTYAARYCFEKNRDTNGDGVIKGAEIKWYLPSVEEELLIYAGGESWSPVLADRWIVNGVYISSSQYAVAQILCVTFSTGLTGFITQTNASSVRCVRRM